MAGIYRQRHPELTVFYRVLFIHVLVTEGGAAPDDAVHHVPRFHDETICELFIHEVFSLLLRKKLIGLPLVQKILRWPHTGLNVRVEVK